VESSGALPVTQVETSVSLKDGRDITIRTMTAADTEDSYNFFCSLPDEDRRYLRVDVTRRELVENRILEMSGNRVERLVAVQGDAIVADGALELAGHGWGNNIGELRLIVGRDFQRQGLGSLMSRELYFLAVQHKLDRIVVRVMRPQIGAQRIMHRLGFREEFLIPKHVRDLRGEWQDLIIMRCNLDDMWCEMESLFEKGDWRWHP
jgi:RimJ/RimL family protein N-acetyltransferase